ncbi:hypothetical protein UA08_08225 [Talaromyces atroroseus]|uniref:Atg28p n=1 Tax=Talaromyces atroroseus TaxID=1441469 RepID=A0A225ALL2_TALAT|nr:hypothetical protein UA08_08225 [Talaromyces atroroseus]OKL56449.1 hypothetical protein UA08_08225 [Talaromyces atroroseus]
MRSPGHANSDITSNQGSNTPTSAIGSPDRGVRTIPIRQPPRKKTGLRAARKGILRSMSDLLTLREEEKRLVQHRIQQRQDTITEIDTFANKKERLEKTISDMENDREGERARKLKGEAKSLEHEINELELKLADMKARHRHIIQEVSRIENSVDAKLSSYKESLSILDTEVRRYLGNPPLQPLRPDVDRSSFYSLHPKRRTLEMARDHWRTEQTELKERLHNVDLEIAALDDGGPLWQSVIRQISAFERRLKDEMQQSIILSKSMLPGLGNPADQQEQGRRILADLEITTRQIEEKLEMAEEKDWRLLVCSIGAELQALREAQSLLKQAFDYKQPEEQEDENEPVIGAADNDDNDQQRTVKETKDRNSNNHPPPTITIPSEDDEHADEPPADLLKDLTSEDVKAMAFRSEDEDDEPDPAWLLSDP